MCVCEIRTNKGPDSCVYSATPFFLITLSFPSISCQSPETAFAEITTADEDSLIQSLSHTIV